MTNTIELAKKYAPLLDAKLALESRTSILDLSPALVRAVVGQANAVLIPKMTLQGLADYSRASGFVGGDAILEWVTHTLTHDRGRTFSIDAMDNEESAGIAFGNLAGEFLKVHVAPELDAYRLSTYASKAGTAIAETLTEANVVTAIDEAIGTLDDAEVAAEDRVIFVSTDTNTLMKNSEKLSRKFDVQTSNGVVNRNITTFDGSPIIKVPSNRFFTEYLFKDGTTAGQTAGGFTATDDAVAMNFMMLSKSAVMQIVKHALLRIFAPEQNQTADAWKFDYRVYGDAFVYDNKVNGIYVSQAESDS